MLPSIRTCRTQAERTTAQLNNVMTLQRLAVLSRRQENALCCDCTADASEWIVLPYGMFVCDTCASVHRELGPLVSIVKSFRQPELLWFPDELIAVETMGNTRARTICLHKTGAPPKMDVHAPLESKRHRARAVYELQQYMKHGRNASPEPPASNADMALTFDNNAFFKSFGL